jgi:D-alanyl-D-alanine carboxypeptidase
VADVSDLNPAFSSRLDAFKAALDKAGIGYSIASGYRSPEYQAQMFANHQAKSAGQPLPYPNVEAPDVVAPAWRSFHNYGLAADFSLKNPADYARLAQMAPQFGLSGIGASDPGHIQMSGTLADDINQYHLANWRPAGQPAPAQGAIAFGGPPGGQPPAALQARAGTPAAGSSFFDALSQIESNNRNVFSGVDKDYPGQPGSRSQGYFQIDTPTWQQFGAKAGIDLKQYPTAMNAPRDVQQSVASLIPLSRFGPRTQRMLGQQFGQLDTSQTIGQIASNIPGSTINTTGGPAASGAPTAAAGGPPATSAPQAPGTALPGFQPGSTANKMTTAGLQTLAGKGGGQTDQPPPMPSAPPIPQAQAAGGPMMIGYGGQNTMGQRVAQQALAQAGLRLQPSLADFQLGGVRPPSLNAQPPGGQAPGAATGMPSLPGTTLNSPSALQMALMTGQLNPYDLYASGYGAGGFQGSA